MFARAEVKFIGKVQGVYFRAYTKKFADELSVNGRVRNLSDGTVFAIFEGKKEQIEEVIRKLRYEHPYAKVDSVEITWLPYRNEFYDFRIIYD
ncbi:MAG: acylphosphatase [Methanomassiliicoccales archaeon]